MALRPARPWTDQERLGFELEASGLFLSGHPMDDLADVLRERRALFYAEAIEMVGQEQQAVCRMAGVLRAKVERMLPSGRFAFVTFSDPTGEYEVAVIPETLQDVRPLLEVGKMLTFKARLRQRDGEIRITAEGFEVLDPNKGPQAKGLRVSLREGAPIQPLAKAVSQVCAASEAPRGALRLVLTLADGREVEIEAGGALPAEPAARAALKAARGVEDVAWI
jgi:DNA polymerase-3 subunit alpha